MRRNYRQEKRRPGCRFCANPQRYVIDYKNVRLLERFVDEDGKGVDSIAIEFASYH